MESAREFIEYYFNGQLHLQGELEKMLSERDAKIRKECADRAVEAIGNIPPSKRAIWEVVETAIRAAIMGDKHE